MRRLTSARHYGIVMALRENRALTGPEICQLTNRGTRLVILDLAELERQGLVVSGLAISSDGVTRRYYCITPEGRKRR